MPFDDLQSYLRELEAHGELRRVTAPVSAELEVTEIANRTLRENGPALLFENVDGSAYPLAINIMASERRIELALGMHPEKLGEELAAFVERMSTPGLRELWNGRRTVRRLMAFRPRFPRRPPVHEVSETSPDLSGLPALKCWPGDAGRFLTLPLVVSRDPAGGAHNMGIYRMQLYDSRTAGMHIQIQRGGGFHYHEAEKQGQPLEMAIVLGGDPALILAAVMALPEGIDEAAFSGILRGRRTPMAHTKTLGLRVPANAEFVLEGVVPPGERRLEGPFGDHFGHYSEQAEFPVFHLQAMTHRRRPVFPAAVVGRPPQEDRYLGDASQQALIPLIRLMRREVRDLWAYYEAGFHNLLAVSVEPRYAREPIRTALGLLGEGQLSLTKVLVLVGPDVNPRDRGAVLKAIRSHFTPEEDFILVSQAPVDTLDFTGEGTHLGSKMIIDATPRGRPASANAVPLPKDLKAIVPHAIRWRLVGHTLLVVQVPGEGRAAVEAMVASPLLASVKIVAAVSGDVDIDSDVDLMWALFTRFDPGRDVAFTKTEMRGVIPTYRGVMGIDATWKETYPDVIEMSPDIVKKVDDRWSEYWT